MKELLRFWRQVEKRGHRGCWVWTGKLDRNQNAQFCVMNRTVSARRLAWELSSGDDQPLDTRVKIIPLCGTIACVRPEHMQPMVGGGRKPLEKCARGHDFTEENVYWTTQGKRACRQCIRVTLAARKKRYLKEGRGWGRTYKPLKRKRQRVKEGQAHG